MNKAYNHFKIITKHRHQVIKNCYKAGILPQGLRHDLSKYSFTEFFNGVKYFDGTRSPNELERRDIGYSRAWLHHKGRNKHHFEYWTDYNPVEKKSMPVKMPLKYVVEMFCDRVAASKTYQKEKYTDASAYEYFVRGTANRNMHPQTGELLGKLLLMLSEKGEKETFSYIKNTLLKNKDY